MPPHSTAEADMAVALVLGGMSVQSAWEQSGQPGKTRESGQRNIRSRVKRARESEVAAPLPKAAKRGKMVYNKCKHGREPGSAAGARTAAAAASASMAGDSTGAMIVAAATSASTGGRSNSARRQCGGSSICEHQRQRSKCKECGGGGPVTFVEATEVEEFDEEEDLDELVPTVQARVVGGPRGGKRKR